MTHSDETAHFDMLAAILAAPSTAGLTAAEAAHRWAEVRAALIEQRAAPIPGWVPSVGD